MRWSKLRSSVKERFSEELQGRLDINSTAYGNCSCGHAWLTFDKTVIANFCTRAAYIAQGYETSSSPVSAAYKHQFAEFGELSRQDAYKACWAFLHELNIEKALQDNDPLVQCLAVSDARVGQRRLAKLKVEQLHPLAAAIWMFRTTGALPPAVALKV
jgi:hypothetical protein